MFTRPGLGTGMPDVSAAVYVHESNPTCKFECELLARAIPGMLAMHIYLILVQKFLERGSPEQRDALGNVMRSHVLDLSLDMFGCRVVQKAIEVSCPCACMS